jgi:branched-chain amino acid transport system substrate-binding protein
MSTRINRRRIASLGAAMAFALLAVPGAAADVVEIPVVLPFTGPAAFLGKGTQQGVQGVEDLTNRTGGIGGKKLRFVFQDDQSSPKVAVELLNGILAQKPAVVMGSTIVATCRAMAALIKDGPVMYCFSPGLHPDEGSYAFSGNVSTADSIDVGLGYFVKSGLTRMAVITATDSTGQDADKAIDDSVAAAHGAITIVDREHFNPGDVSVSAQMAKIKAANPQVLVAWVTGTPVATVFHAVKDLGLDVPVYTSNGNSISAFLKQWATVLPKNLLLPASANVIPQAVTDRPGKAALATYYDEMKRLGFTPDIMNGTGWDPAMLIVSALRKVGPDGSAADVHAYLEGLNGWTGILGKYDFRASSQRGLGRDAVYIARWDPAGESWIAVSRGGGVPIR